MEFVSTTEAALALSDLVLEVRAPVGRRRAIGALTVVLGLFIVVAFGFGSVSGAHSQFTFTPVNTSSGAPWTLGALTVFSRWWNVALGLITVAIGAEHGILPLADCSVVVAPYEVDGERAGTVGVLGPTRMHYDQALAAVAVVSKKLSRALSEGGDGDDLGDLERSSHRG